MKVQKDFLYVEKVVIKMCSENSEKLKDVEFACLKDPYE